MSIGPMDYQILMPKVNETGKIQSESQQKMINQAQQQADNSIKQSERDIKSVHTQSEAQKTVITEDQGRRQHHQQKLQTGRQRETRREKKKKYYHKKDTQLIFVYKHVFT